MVHPERNRTENTTSGMNVLRIFMVFTGPVRDGIRHWQLKRYRGIHSLLTLRSKDRALLFNKLAPSFVHT